MPKINDQNIGLAQRICQYIEDNQPQPSLAELAAYFNFSPYHLQREFKRVVGISPRQYADELRLKQLKRELKNGTPVTAALHESGYGSISSLYGRTSQQLGMTPVNYRSGAAKLKISFSTVRCSLGWLLVATTDRGICALSLGDSANRLIEWLHEEFPQATITKDDGDLRHHIEMILNYLNGEQPHCDLPLDVQATAFQRRVWEELRRIPYGATRSYSDIASALGRPTASRAVARACASNPVSLIIPCHRVVRKGGALGGYRWNLKRKKALLAMEQSSKPVRLPEEFLNR